MRNPCTMNVIVHYPTSPQNEAELARRVSEAHAFACVTHIQNLTCSTEQKLKLLDAIQNDASVN